MPVTRTGQFLETSDLGITHSLGIESAQPADCIAEIEQRHIQGIFANPEFGFEESNLDFLTQLPQIRQLWFWDIRLQDVDGIYHLENLEYLGIFPKRPAIDFSRFPKLATMVWEPVKNDAGLEKLSSLNCLHIWRYKSKEMSFSALPLPVSLRELAFNWCNQESLLHLPQLPHLETLEIHYCRNLKSLNGLMTIAPNLKRLTVDNCANLESVEEALAMNIDDIYIRMRGNIVVNKGK